MTADITTLDAHEQPSGYLRQKWKAYARAPAAEILQSGDIDDYAAAEAESKPEASEAAKPQPGTSQKPKRQPLRVAGTLSADRVGRALLQFLADRSPVDGDIDQDTDDLGLPAADLPIYHHPLLPGLLVVPNLVPPRVQLRLLDRMVHRDLSCPRHQTNMHLHYDLPYPPPAAAATSSSSSSSSSPASFFSYPPASPNHSHDAAAAANAAPLPPGTFLPHDPSVHRPLTISQVLDRRLHWVTLGGQYDWTNRVYPTADGDGESADDKIDDPYPAFPPDLARLLAGLFPETDAQAAIVNFYTPGDTMMMHRDVSEKTDRGLISLSLGCEALFMAAPTAEFAARAEDGTPGTATTADGREQSAPEPYVLLRLRSGDAVYMTGHARFAWHGVPKVLKGTCPAYLADWPAGEHADGRYEAWRGWMRNKRINLNARQMQDGETR